VSGNNENGQCGLSSTANQKVPTKVPIPSGKPVISIGSGARHTAIVTDDGKLYTCGHNDKNQLGVTTQQVSVGNFLVVNSPAHFVSVACGDSHTLALTSDGRVFAFGDNTHGQLGTASNALVAPVQINEKITGIAAGNLHSVILSDSGLVYAFGSNANGQLNQSHLNNLAVPTKILLSEKVVMIGAGYMHTACVTATGEVRVYGFLSRDLSFGSMGKLVGTFNPNSNERLVQMSSGSTHIFGLTAGGQVYGMGVNGHGQLGLGSSGAKFTEHMGPVPGVRGRATGVACGFQHSVVSNDRGEVFACGRNERFQLGINSNGHQQSLVQVQLPQGFALKDVFCVSTSGHATTGATSTTVLPEETVELVLPERQFHQGYQSVGEMFGISSETSTIPPPSQKFGIQPNKRN